MWCRNCTSRCPGQKLLDLDAWRLHAPFPPLQRRSGLDVEDHHVLRGVGEGRAIEDVLLVALLVDVAEEVEARTAKAHALPSSKHVDI